MVAWRWLYRHAFTDSFADRDRTWRVFDRDLCERCLPPESLRRKSQMFRIDGAGTQVRMKRELLHPRPFCREFIDREIAEDRLRYEITRNIRATYGLSFSPGTARSFLRMASVLRERTTGSGVRNEESVDADELRAGLGEAVEGPGRDNLVAAFEESCALVNYIKLGRKLNEIRFHPQTIEAEFLLSHLFGMPTSIQGFDMLFGGGGIILPGHQGRRRPLEAFEDGEIPGRTVVISGRFGAGKSLLAMQLAVEVARKGGLGWIMPMEQSAVECRYVLESMGLIRGGEFDLATDVESVWKVLGSDVKGRGALIILSTPKSSYEFFLRAIRDNAARAPDRFDLVLLVIDPINSVYAASATDQQDASIRTTTLDELDPIKRSGCNVVIVQEDRVEDDERAFEKFIADTVVRMTVERIGGYSQRFLEITKSRYQREQRGHHSFTIVPGRGLGILPSSASVSVRIRNREAPVGRGKLDLGIPGLERVVGEVADGEVIVFEGPRGSHQSESGAMFLMVPHREHHVSLFVSIGRPARWARDVVQRMRHAAPQLQCRERLRYLALPEGYVNPGVVFQSIESAFDEERSHGRQIDRVLIDSVSNWTMNCPLIAHDQVFAPTLLDLMRKRGATSAFMCSGSGDPLQQSLIEGADCHIQSRLFDYRGSQRVAGQVQRTTAGTHRREPFEIHLGRNGLEVKPLLVQFDHLGRVLPIKVRLFLHVESVAHRDYYNLIEATLKAAVSPEVVVDSAEAINWSRSLSRQDASALDELRIVQIDEFQLRDDLRPQESEVGPLYAFPAEVAGKAFAENIPLHMRPSVREKSGLVNALPFLDNVSLLAFRNGAIPEGKRSSWDHIAQVAHESQDDRPEAPPFFDFPRKSPENYNCMYFEILLSLLDPEQRQADGKSEWLQQVLDTEAAIHAGALYRRLCRPAIMCRVHDEGGDTAGARSRSSVSRMLPLDPVTRNAEAIDVHPGAQVWRHWFTTLSEMLDSMSPEIAEGIRVEPLPGDIAISGTWFLGIPADSAAPDDGVKIIASLLTREAELERLSYGVGLPVRKQFYADHPGGDGEVEFLSSRIEIGRKSLARLIDNAWHRSGIQGYARISRVLSTHLERIAVSPLGTRSDEEIVRTQLRALRHRLQYVVS